MPISSLQAAQVGRRGHSGVHVSLQIYRSFEIGKLIKLIMLDTRIIGRNLQNFTDRLVRKRNSTTRQFNRSNMLTPANHLAWLEPPAAMSTNAFHAPPGN